MQKKHDFPAPTTRRPQLGLPPRDDAPIDERIAWYQTAIRQLGCRPIFHDKDKDLTLHFLVHEYWEAGGEERRFRDSFAPPLDLPPSISSPTEQKSGCPRGQ